MAAAAAMLVGRRMKKNLAGDEKEVEEKLRIKRKKVLIFSLLQINLLVVSAFLPFPSLAS